MNESPPEVQSPGGNRASTNQNTDTPIIDAEAVDGKPVDRAEKELATCRAKLAMYAGLSLYELSDGTFLATNHRSTHPLRDRHAVAMLVRKLEGAM